MQNYVVNLQSDLPNSFRCQKAANSVNLDVAKKSIHRLEVKADLKTKFNVGLIIGSSGSGKTTLAKSIYGDNCMMECIDLKKPVIDQLPDNYSYDECAAALTGMGLTSIPCWLRPAYTLSTGQRARAEASLRLANIGAAPVVVDEWTSTVDRAVAKVMSHCIQKHARRIDKTVVLVSCHRDVIDWLNPDWVIDCNDQTYNDRRSMVGSHKRSDRLRLDIRECKRSTWKYFSKYHYLSETMPAGKVFTFGLYNGEDQVGFTCFANYSWKDNKQMHSNRVVIHPDYVGLGLGIKLATEASEIMVSRGYTVRAKFASIAMFKARRKHAQWRCLDIKRHVTNRSNGVITEDIACANGSVRKAAERNASKLYKVTYFYYEFVPKRSTVLPKSLSRSKKVSLRKPRAKV